MKTKCLKINLVPLMAAMALAGCTPAGGIPDGGQAQTQTRKQANGESRENPYAVGKKRRI